MFGLSNPSSFSSLYAPIKLLGEGGYGAVWLVKRLSDSTLHAAKIMKDSKCRRKTWCSNRSMMVPDEIVLSEHLSHPNLLHLEEVFFEQESWIIVMEFLSGYMDLFEYTSKNGPLSAEDSKDVLRQLIETCYYLVSEDIDHRDIKDENILYNPETKQMKLIDFGSASIIPDGAYTKFQGTDVYVPPELYIYGSYSALPAMSWSIGCLAYVLLNGDAPFKSKQEVAEYKTLKFLNPSLDQASREFLREVLKAEESDRMLLSELIDHPWLQEEIEYMF